MPASVGTTVTSVRAARLLDELGPAAEAALDAALGGRGRGRAALERRRDGASPEERRRWVELERRAFSAEADPAALEELALLRARLREQNGALDAAVAGLAAPAGPAVAQGRVGRATASGWDETGRDETGRDGTGRDGTGRDEIGRDETGRDETGRVRTGRDGTGRDETGRDGTGRDETGRDETGRDETGRDESGRGEPGRDAPPGWGERSGTTGGDDADFRDSVPPRPRRLLGVIAALVAVLGLAALGAAASVALAPRPSLEVFTEPWDVPDDVATRPLSTLASLRVFHWGPTRYLGSIAGVDYFATLSLDSFSAAELADESVCLYGLARSDGDVVVTDCAATADFVATGMTLSPDDYHGDAGGAGVAWGPTGGIRSAG
ncbi:hypothetical protein C5D34_05510 [Rathayibacter sp. AY1B1]|uniref:hypothetical protein n=1 Tax=unclassified Rathayibacter TaxID=2609250 RepID=UPI000CE8ED75|nr:MULTISPECIES: hypothetical protein [unclassified Rathayibacter]PPI24230.1 hypothetical protein C5D08_03265 [Rathayibacter sp. AY1B6]PPI36696.1 hypothetical protein C5D34_05510 [Rathayibacter sp. AY1B1]